MVGEAFAKASPDVLLVIAAEQIGLVVITFDRDFKHLIKQFPEGTRGQVSRSAGRIILTCREDEARIRIEELVEVIEFNYDQATKRNTRFVMQISRTSYSVAG